MPKTNKMSVSFRPNPRFNTKVLEAAKATTDIFQMDVVQEAKRNAPVLTGTLRRSIDSEVRQQGTRLEANLFTQCGYGAYPELGTVRMQAQPYMWPAFEKYKSKIIQAARNVFKK